MTVSPVDTRRSPTSVIFDLDGTLLDTIEDMTDAVNAALEQRGYPTRSVEEVKYLVGEGTEVFAGGALLSGGCFTTATITALPGSPPA